MINIPISYANNYSTHALSLAVKIDSMNFAEWARWKKWLIFFLGAFLATYIWVMNDIGTKSTELSYLKQRAQKLQEEQTTLQIKISTLNGLSDLDKQVQSLGLVAVTNPSFIKVPPTNVALK